VEVLRHSVETTVELLAVGRVLVHAVGVGTGQLLQSRTAGDILSPVAAVALGGKVGSGVGTGAAVGYAGHTLVELATVDRITVGAGGVGADDSILFVNSRFTEMNILVVMDIVLLIKFFMMRYFLVEMMMLVFFRVTLRRRTL
jgi:hypothetical protein